jgi:hypothetical protein
MPGTGIKLNPKTHHGSVFGGSLYHSNLDRGPNGWTIQKPEVKFVRILNEGSGVNNSKFLHLQNNGPSLKPVITGSHILASSKRV